MFFLVDDCLNITFFSLFKVMCAREAMICYVKEIGALAQESDNRTIITTIGRIQRNIGAALVSIPKHSAA